MRTQAECQETWSQMDAHLIGKIISSANFSIPINLPSADWVVSTFNAGIQDDSPCATGSTWRPVMNM